MFRKTFGALATVAALYFTGCNSDVSVIDNNKNQAYVTKSESSDNLKILSEFFKSGKDRKVKLTYNDHTYNRLDSHSEVSTLDTDRDGTPDKLIAHVESDINSDFKYDPNHFELVGSLSDGNLETCKATFEYITNKCDMAYVDSHQLIDFRNQTIDQIVDIIPISKLFTSNDLPKAKRLSDSIPKNLADRCKAAYSSIIELASNAVIKGETDFFTTEDYANKGTYELFTNLGYNLMEIQPNNHELPLVYLDTLFALGFDNIAFVDVYKNPEKTILKALDILHGETCYAPVVDKDAIDSVKGFISSTEPFYSKHSTPLIKAVYKELKRLGIVEFKKVRGSPYLIIDDREARKLTPGTIMGVSGSVNNVLNNLREQS